MAIEPMAIEPINSPAIPTGHTKTEIVSKRSYVPQLLLAIRTNETNVNFLKARVDPCSSGNLIRGSAIPNSFIFRVRDGLGGTTASKTSLGTFVTKKAVKLPFLLPELSSRRFV